jgi:pimeloyl-ACP methyl ester carboxylesterase
MKLISGEVTMTINESYLSEKRLKPPHLGLFLAEGRGLLELNATLLMTPALLTAPRGDGHPVLVLPGLLASDMSTLILRRYLDLLGFSTHPWGLGRNTGGVYSMRDKLGKLLSSVHAATGRKISLVGWSLGGVYSRDLAIRYPDMVRYVVTLGSPFAGDITATNAKRIYEMLSGETIEDADMRDIQAIGGDLPVPTSSVYTRTDGIVNWRTCLNRVSDSAENIEITLASHIGIGVNAAALWAVADRLAQPEGEFNPFDRSGPFAMAYARPDRS